MKLLLAALCGVLFLMSPLKGDEEIDESDREMRLIVYSTTISITSLTTITTTVPTTCLSVTNTPVCGRRRRSIKLIAPINFREKNTDVELDATSQGQAGEATFKESMIEETMLEEMSRLSRNRQGRPLTLRSTTFTTLTQTITSSNAASTISFSALCTSTAFTMGCSG